MSFLAEFKQVSIPSKIGWLQSIVYMALVVYALVLPFFGTFSKFFPRTLLVDHFAELPNNAISTEEFAYCTADSGSVDSDSSDSKSRLPCKIMDIGQIGPPSLSSVFVTTRSTLRSQRKLNNSTEYETIQEEEWYTAGIENLMLNFHFFWFSKDENGMSYENSSELATGFLLYRNNTIVCYQNALTPDEVHERESIPGALYGRISLMELLEVAEVSLSSHDLRYNGATFVIVVNFESFDIAPDKNDPNNDPVTGWPLNLNYFGSPSEQLNTMFRLEILRVYDNRAPLEPFSMVASIDHPDPDTRVLLVRAGIRFVFATVSPLGRSSLSVLFTEVCSRIFLFWISELCFTFFLRDYIKGFLHVDAVDLNKFISLRQSLLRFISVSPARARRLTEYVEARGRAKDLLPYNEARIIFLMMKHNNLLATPAMLTNAGVLPELGTQANFLRDLPPDLLQGLREIYQYLDHYECKHMGKAQGESISGQTVRLVFYLPYQDDAAEALDFDGFVAFLIEHATILTILDLVDGMSLEQRAEQKVHGVAASILARARVRANLKLILGRQSAERKAELRQELGVGDEAKGAETAGLDDKMNDLIRVGGAFPKGSY